MKHLLIIQADTNDGDYITAEHEIGSDFFTYEDFEIFKRVYSIVKKNKERPGRWYNGSNKFDTPDYFLNMYKDLASEEDLECFDEMLPADGSDYGIHTIKSVRVLEVAKDEEL